MVQCQATTKSGNQCSRKSTSKGFCKQHISSSKNLSPKKRALENEEENVPPAKRLKPEPETEIPEKKMEEKSTPKTEKQPTHKAEKIEIVQQEIKQLEEEILVKKVTHVPEPPEKEKTKEEIVEKMQPTIEKSIMEVEMPVKNSGFPSPGDFSGGEENFDISGAEESSDEEYDSDASRAKYRSGSLSPPPPECLVIKRRPKSRFKPKPVEQPAAPQVAPPPPPVNPASRFEKVTASDNYDLAKQLQLKIEAELNMLSSGLLEDKLPEEPVLPMRVDYDPTIFDTRVGGGLTGRKIRKGRALKFFKQGSLVKKANRITQLLERQYIHATPSAAAMAELDDDVNYMSGDEIPEVEWWDKNYIIGAEGYDAKKLKLDLITHYIHHPRALGDLSMEEAPKMPLYLTKREKDKRRRKKSKAKHDEMIDKIILGIEKPPEPKLKLSNIVRVLGSQSYADPSAAEGKAKTQMRIRRMKHLLHNENRRLTPSQRSEKKRKQLLEDTNKEVHVSVFRVSNLSDTKIQWKIKTNAKQYNLTGRMLLFKNMNMVLVEGGVKGIRRLTALMTRRINWSEKETSTPCIHVWQGITGSPVFQEFLVETFEEETDVIKYLDQKKVLGYWKQCKEFQDYETFNTTK